MLYRFARMPRRPSPMLGGFERALDCPRWMGSPTTRLASHGELSQNHPVRGRNGLVDAPSGRAEAELCSRRARRVEWAPRTFVRVRYRSQSAARRHASPATGRAGTGTPPCPTEPARATPDPLQAVAQLGRMEARPLRADDCRILARGNRFELTPRRKRSRPSGLSGNRTDPGACRATNVCPVLGTGLRFHEQFTIPAVMNSMNAAAGLDTASRRGRAS